MIIKESPEKSKALMDALRESFRETRGRGENQQIHLSDLLYPRKAFFGRTTETLPTETEVLYWAAGRAHEDIMARLTGMVTAQAPVLAEVPGLVIGEPREVLGINYRPDFRWIEAREQGMDAYPAELKTSRFSIPEPGEEGIVFEAYLNQLCGYCVLDEVTEGYLIVFFLHAPALVVYHVSFTAGELARMGQTLMLRGLALKKSLKNKKHQDLELCPEGFCGSRKKYIIAPAFCEGCQTDMTQAQANRHIKTKKGSGHIIRAPINGWFYKPKCKFYDDCKPWEKDEIRKQW